MKKIHVPIYGVNIYVAVADTILEASRQLPRPKFGKLKKKEVRNCKAYYWANHRGDFALLFRTDKLQPKHFAHEIYHCTDGIIDYIDEQTLITGSEVMAYLNDFITDQVYKKLDITLCVGSD